MSVLGDHLCIITGVDLSDYYLDNIQSAAFVQQLYEKCLLAFNIKGCGTGNDALLDLPTQSHCMVLAFPVSPECIRWRTGATPGGS